MASADQVAELMKEVETLRALLEHERKKSASATVVSPKAPEPVSLSPVKPLDTQRAQSPRVSMNSSSKARSQQFEPQQQPVTEMEWNDPPVGTKRGKWWLQDRQILSRNAPTRRDDCVAVKVREAWLWNGRPVIVDKIVMCVMPVAHSGEDQEDAIPQEQQHRIVPMTPRDAVVSLQQLELNKTPDSASPRSPTRPFRAAKQPSSTSAAVADGCSPVDESAAAALRLESEMRSHQDGI